MKITIGRPKKVFRVGVISDTHGLVRPEALKILREVDLVIHAGDIGKPEVISALQAIAPAVGVRGNNDRDGWARKFPATAIVTVGSVKIYVLHNLKELDLDPVKAGYRVVISGHSHQPSLTRKQGVLFLNPGSAGPRRFKLPVAVAKMQIKNAEVRARILELKA